MSGPVQREPQIDSLKGVLILLIILGHNYFFSQHFPLWFAALYNFHVACFLLLPFLFSMEEVGFERFRDRIVRALAPHVAFLVVALVAYFVLYVEKDSQIVAEWGRKVVLALLVQNEGVLNDAAGFRHFWFLPAMITLMCLLYMHDRGGLAFRRFFLVVASLLHLGIGMIPSYILNYIPWGLPIVSFLLLPGLLVRWIRENIRWVPMIDAGLLFVWFLLLVLVVEGRLFFSLAGDLSGVPSLFQPGRLLFHDIFLILSFFALMRLASYLPPLFEALGRVSLKLFLIVPLLWQLFWMAGGNELSAGTLPLQWLMIAGSMSLMVGSGYLLSRWIERSRYNALLFPRSLGQWRQGLRVWRSVG